MHLDENYTLYPKCGEPVRVGDMFQYTFSFPFFSLVKHFTGKKCINHKCVFIFIRILQKIEPVGERERQIYYEELTKMIMEAENSHDLTLIKLGTQESQ